MTTLAPQNDAVLGDVSLNKLNSPEKMMAHLNSMVAAESKLNSPSSKNCKVEPADQKFSFKLTQITQDSYISPTKKSLSTSTQESSGSALEAQLRNFDQFILNQRTLLPERLAQ